MNNVLYSTAKISKIVTHHVGSKFHGEQSYHSTDYSILKDYSIDLFMDYLLKPIKWDEFYAFGSEKASEMRKFADRIFNDQESIIETSKDIADHLYECGDHSNIKSGEMNCVLFDNMEFDGKQVQALGIFKSTEKSAFIQFDKQDSNYVISHDYAYPSKGVDKGCLILNIDSEKGYRIFLYENRATTNFSNYWQHDFCQVQVCKNDFHTTAAVMNMTRNFLTEQLDEDFEVSAPDKIDLMNKSAAYFKQNDQFDQGGFEREVFQDENVINSFRDYSKSQDGYDKLVIEDRFDISKNAVKKNAKVFKSVLKLDKNFHVYIHGNRSLIERGEENGKKYYKLYYSEES